MHSKYIIHRDLKAENILIKNIDKNKEIDIKIIDFGISCTIKPDEKLKSVFGTPYYIAPEIL